MTYFSFFSKVDTYEQQVFYLKTQLVARGWVVKASSDATTYNATGDQITGFNSGANGLANTNAWFRIQCPSMGGVTRELTFQRSTTTNWRIKYSYSAGFTGGTPGITQTASATDEQILLGGGTDASPTYSSLFSGTNKYGFITCGDSNEGYAFYSLLLGQQPLAYNSQISNFFAMDRISSGSISAGDVDGYVFYITAGATLNTSLTPKGYYKKGLSGEAFTSFLIYDWTIQSRTFATNTFGSNMSNNKCNVLPILYGRTTAPIGYKGFSHMIGVATMQWFSGTLLTSASLNDKIVAHTFILPWDGVTTVYLG